MRSMIVFFLVLVMSACNCFALDSSDLLFYAPFDNSLEPVVSRSQGSESVGSPKFDKGLFAGSVEVGNGSSVSYPLKDNFKPESGSISFWIKSSQKYYEGLATGTEISKKIITSPGIFNLEIYDNGWLTFSYGEGGFAGAYPPGSIQNNLHIDWQHIVIVWGEGKISVYCNSEPYCAGTMPDIIPDISEDSRFTLAIQPQKVPTSLSFDDLMIFNRPLKEQEVKILYRKGLLEGKPSYIESKPEEKNWFSYEAPKFNVPRMTESDSLNNYSSISGFVENIFGLYCGLPIYSDFAWDSENLSITINQPKDSNLPVRILINPANDPCHTIYGFSNTNSLPSSLQPKNVLWKTLSNIQNIDNGEGYNSVAFKISLKDISIITPENQVLKVNIIIGDTKSIYTGKCISLAPVYRTTIQQPDPNTFAQITLTDSKPAVKITDLGNLTEGKLTIEGFVLPSNAATPNLKLSANVHRTDLRSWYEYYDRYNGDTFFNNKSLDIANGKKTPIQLEKRFFNRDFNGLFLTISDEKSNEIMFHQIVPFHFNPTIMANVKPFPSFGYMIVDIDTEGYTGTDRKNLSIKLQTVGSDDKTYETKILPLENKTTAQTKLDLSSLPIGKTTIRTFLMNEKDQVLADSGVGFEIPQKFEWQDKNPGNDDVVIKPLTPLEVKDTQVSMWGRTYIWDKSLFPTQIINQKQKMLAMPISISASESFEDKANIADVAVIDKSNTKADLISKGSISGIPVEIKTHIEYDGLVYFEMTFEPKESTSISGLYLSIPIDANCSTLYHCNAGGWGSYYSGAMTQSMDFKQLPVYWLGNEDLGLVFLIENIQGWNVKNPDKIVSFIKSDKSNRMIIRLSDSQFTIKPDQTIQFGINATPVKPLPDGWRFIRNQQSYTWSNYTGITDTQTSPRFALPWYKDFIAGYKAKGVELFYQYQWMANANPDLPELPYFKYEWQSNPAIYGVNSICTGAKSYCDLMIHDTMKYVIDGCGSDGVYCDAGSLLTCFNESHNHGWRDNQGNLQSSYTILSLRDFYRRMARELEKRRERYVIKTNAAGANCVPAHNFITTAWNGEQFSIRAANCRDYTQLISLPHFRAEFMSQQWGFITEWLIQFGGIGIDYDATDTALVLSLPHGVADLGAKSELGSLENSAYYHSVCDAQLAAGVRNMEFLPYWENSDIVKVSPENPNIVCSIWRGKNKAIVILANLTADDINANIKLNLEKLGLLGDIKVYDAYQEYRAAILDIKDKTEISDIKLKSFKDIYERTCKILNADIVGKIPDLAQMRHLILGNTLSANCKKKNWRMIVLEDN